MISYALLQKTYSHLDGPALLETMITKVFPGRIALVSSFGAESAVLAHMVSNIDPATAIVFVDTGRLFPETLAYRDQLIERLGLTNVKINSPSREETGQLDPDLQLFASDADACCAFRKIEPMERGLRGYQAWITGRKQFHGGDRAELPVLEPSDWRLKINPLANWTPGDITAYYEAHDLPRHPLVGAKYLSIGCVPCTTPVNEGEDSRAGRWRGQEKTECGIHWTVDGRPVPAPGEALGKAKAG